MKYDGYIEVNSLLEALDKMNIKYVIVPNPYCGGGSIVFYEYGTKDDPLCVIFERG